MDDRARGQVVLGAVLAAVGVGLLAGWAWALLVAGVAMVVAGVAGWLMSEL